ncbi:undecaprenyl-diphosphate phosphatase [Rossellomorea vietnamensis]|uniref:Undecaprenyl-diphosphatase n=1 Tax=Rossellomorea vietnamensis TaxID=218284 RepID=A0A5D4NRC9_9BACI|nr:undecaprenyl-diphosphate phosphatase [Rossellomorea vietnamensis]TYS16151.1 undecaprenyl-diphosphate phosphatase [Rossellomorea vietnamensis]
MNEIIIAIILGIIEGLTEFLPVSSTGHLILAGHFLDFTGEKEKTFSIFIQLGAIMAVVVYYWKRVLSILKFNFKEGLNVLHILFAMLPAVMVGLLLHDLIKEYLFSPQTVIVALAVGGVLLIYAEKKNQRVLTESLDELTYKQAFRIGFFQCLALFPGFSRAGATIAGGILSGANHKTAAEFSFLVAVPMMFAASGLDLVKSYEVISVSDVDMFMAGFFSAFIVALIAIMSFLKLLSKVKLTPFAYYRFALAAVVALFLL